MYLGIDVGATKTLFAVFEASGKLVMTHRIKTSPDYAQFLADITNIIDGELKEYKFTACCCAVPGPIDVQTGIVNAFGNLPWQDVHIRDDLQKLLPGVKILAHNDAKLAGLSEAKLLHKKYNKVLYITISTGIGGGIIIDDVIDSNFVDFEPGRMRFDVDGENQKWESFASGKALYKKYGKLASEIDDEAIWSDFSKLLAMGVEELLATIQPDVVVFGGGMGTHFDKYSRFLLENLNNHKDSLVPIPPLLKAQRPEEAVIYGCYDFIRQNL